MHFDYLAFNMVGHTCYMVYNVGLYSVTSVKEEYQRRHPFGANPIAINDIFFPVHAVILCLIAIVQCFCYEVYFHFLYISLVSTYIFSQNGIKAVLFSISFFSEGPRKYQQLVEY